MSAYTSKSVLCIWVQFTLAFVQKKEVEMVLSGKNDLKRMFWMELYMLQLEYDWNIICYMIDCYVLYGYIIAHRANRLTQKGND